ncbi:MAG: TlpA disulfide reductase family protein [Isosphaeraceae bacterium]
MRPLLPLLLALTLAAGNVTTNARADEILNIGDPAPPLSLAKWLKGDKIDRFEPRRIYVVVFWATWAPVQEAIPHLTDLAHKYRDRGVRFLAIDSYEDEPNQVKPFVDQLGDRIDFSVAMDRAPADNPAQGATARAWLEAAEENGVPTAFVIRDGMIAWMGHPLEIDRPLGEIVAGKWDVAAQARARREAKSLERKARAFRDKVETSYRGKDYSGALAAIDEAITKEPALADEYAKMRFDCLVELGQVDEALKVGDQMLKLHYNQAMGLNNDFFSVVDLAREKAPDPRLVRQALEGLIRANELTKGQNIYILNTLAQTQFRAGDPAAAAATQKQAIRELEAQVTNKSHPFHRTYRQQLDMYRRAADREKKKAS